MFKIGNQNKTIRPIIRNLHPGIQAIGLVNRAADNRTRQELIQTIEAYAQNNAVVKNLKNDILALDNKSIGTVADLLELSYNRELLTPLVSEVNRVYKETVNDNLIQNVIKASKENPKSIKFIDTIINKLDAFSAKYTLAVLPKEIMFDKKVEKQLDVVSDIVPNLAKDTISKEFFNPYELNGQRGFVNYLTFFVNKDNEPQKIQFLFSNLIKLCDRFNERIGIDLDKFFSPKNSLNKMRDNMDSAEFVISKLGDKAENFNVVDFLTKNVNLK